MRSFMLITLISLCARQTAFAQKAPYDSIKLVLDTIRSFDQGYRSIQRSIVEQKKVDSGALQKNVQLIAHYDSINLAKVDQILDHYGWPATNQIGEEGSQTLFMVVQHADLAHQKKVCRIIEEVCRIQTLSASRRSRCLKTKSA